MRASRKASGRVRCGEAPNARRFAGGDPSPSFREGAGPSGALATSHFPREIVPMPAFRLALAALLIAPFAALTAQGGHQHTPPATAQPVPSQPASRNSPADVAFMQGMIGHHAQALVMTDLVAARTDNAELRKLALRIEVSQRDEIALMRTWLTRRGETAPDPLAHAGHDAAHAAHAHMPGMLSDAQLAELRAANGTEFERLFLQFMVQHHEGALVMVRDLFASERGGQETEIFQFASDVDADQQMEIARMRRMLTDRTP